MKSFSVLILLTLFSLNSYSNSSLNSTYGAGFHNLFLIGESHLDDMARNTFKESLDAFKNAQGETLALEMIESSKQILLDNYSNRTQGSEKELSDYLDRRWRYNTKSYMELISKARELELDLIAIDLEKSLWPRETTIFPVIPDISKVREAREAHMAKVLCDYGHYKTVVLIGSFHTLDRFLPAQLKRECFKMSKSIQLAKILNN